MNEPTMETLAQRLDKVERENRWLKQAGVVALALIAALVLMGHVVGEKVIEAERFVLIDSSGDTRAVLAVPEGGSGLYLYDKKGKMRAGLVGGVADETGLSFYDRAGRVIWSAP